MIVNATYAIHTLLTDLFTAIALHTFMIVSDTDAIHTFLTDLFTAIALHGSVVKPILSANEQGICLLSSSGYLHCDGDVW